MDEPYNRGFCLAEVLLTLAIVTIIASFAFPAFTQTLERYRHEAIKQDFIAHLDIARSLSIQKRRRIKICPLHTENICGKNWSAGLTIIDDHNFTILANHALNGSYAIYSTRQNSPFYYQKDGTSGGSNRRLILCDKNNHVVWQIIINLQGRVRSIQGLEKGQTNQILCTPTAST
jgi:prepilin-type N-terminal cleavage/methylation domain-containing protein